jgi:hypothetical protein
MGTYRTQRRGHRSRQRYRFRYVGPQTKVVQVKTNTYGRSLVTLAIQTSTLDNKINWNRRLISDVSSTSDPPSERNLYPTVNNVSSTYLGKHYNPYSSTSPPRSTPTSAMETRYRYDVPKSSSRRLCSII